MGYNYVKLFENMIVFYILRCSMRLFYTPLFFLVCCLSTSMITAMHIGIEHIETKNESAEQAKERRNDQFKRDLVMSTAPDVIKSVAGPLGEVIGTTYRPEAFALLTFGTGLGTLYLKENVDKYHKYVWYGTTGLTAFFAWLAGSEWIDRRERLQEERALKRAAQQRAARRKEA